MSLSGLRLAVAMFTAAPIPASWHEDLTRERAVSTVLWFPFVGAALGALRRGQALKLGLSLGYWTRGPAPGTLEMVLEAERLGFDSAWTAEAYGSDALTPLAWWGANTSTIQLGTGIVQMSARTPAATAMAAMTLDHLSGGRFLLGLGVSGPQVVEGWYGQPYPRPLQRTREYVEIVRRIVARREEQRQPPVAQLGGERDVLRALGAEVDRDVGAQRADDRL